MCAGWSGPEKAIGARDEHAQRRSSAPSRAADPLVAFSPRGRIEPGFTRGLRNLVPRRPGHSIPAEPFATADGRGLLFAWTDFLLGGSAKAEEPELSLRRVLLGY